MNPTICIVCFDFNEANVRLQPWRYIYEIFARLTKKGITVHVITDGYPRLPPEEIFNGIHIYRVSSINHNICMRNQELIVLMQQINPDLLFWTISPTSWIYSRTIRKINKPFIGLWLGTTYSLSQLIGVGFHEIYRNFLHIFSHFLSTAMPTCLIANFMHDPLLKKIIVLNDTNLRNIKRYGFSEKNVLVVPPALEQSDLTIPDVKDSIEFHSKFHIEKNKQIILYFGSPVSIRGTDTAIIAINHLKKIIPNIQLIILSRRKNDNLLKEENFLLDLIQRLGLTNHVHIISGFLTKDDVKHFITISDVVVLPFKFVQADTPLGILEAMALRKVVISTKMDGIPDLLSPDRGILIDPGREDQLASTIQEILINRDLKDRIELNARNYCLNLPDWNEVSDVYCQIVKETHYNG